MRAFKKFMAVAMFAVAVMSVEPAFAQDYSNKEKREFKRERRDSERDLYEKSEKMIRKEAKRRAREGWQSMDLPIEKQLERTYEYLWQTDAIGEPKYVSKSGVVTAKTFNAALRQAETTAKLGIAADMGSLVQAMATQSIGNNGIDPNQAATIDQHVEKVKLLVSSKLGQVLTPTTLYRVKNGHYEVMVTVVYNKKAAIDAAYEATKETLKEDMKLNDADFDALFGYDKLREQYDDMEWDETL